MEFSKGFKEVLAVDGLTSQKHAGALLGGYMGYFASEEYEIFLEGRQGFHQLIHGRASVEAHAKTGRFLDYYGHLISYALDQAALRRGLTFEFEGEQAEWRKKILGMFAIAMSNERRHRVPKPDDFKTSDAYRQRMKQRLIAKIDGRVQEWANKRWGTVFREVYTNPGFPANHSPVASAEDNRRVALATIDEIRAYIVTQAVAPHEGCWKFYMHFGPRILAWANDFAKGNDTWMDERWKYLWTHLWPRLIKWNHKGEFKESAFESWLGRVVGRLLIDFYRQMGK